MVTPNTVPLPLTRCPGDPLNGRFLECNNIVKDVPRGRLSIIELYDIRAMPSIQAHLTKPRSEFESILRLYPVSVPFSKSL